MGDYKGIVGSGTTKEISKSRSKPTYKFKPLILSYKKPDKIIGWEVGRSREGKSSYRFLPCFSIFSYMLKEV